MGKKKVNTVKKKIAVKKTSEIIDEKDIFIRTCAIIKTASAVPVLSPIVK